VNQITDTVDFAVICNIISHKFEGFYGAFCTNDSHLGCDTV